MRRSLGKAKKFANGSARASGAVGHGGVLFEAYELLKFLP